MISKGVTDLIFSHFILMVGSGLPSYKNWLRLPIVLRMIGLKVEGKFTLFYFINVIIIVFYVND